MRLTANNRKLTVTVNLPGDPQFLHQDFDPSFTLGDLKAILLDSNLPDNFPDHTWLLRHNQQVLGSDKDEQSLQQAGMKDDDMLEATPQVAGQQSQQAQRPQGQAQAPQPELSQGEYAQIEQIRQQILSNPQARNDLQRVAPDAFAALNDPPRFRQIWAQVLLQERAAANREDQRLNDDVNEDNQAAILERIRREKINKDFEEVTEEFPELLGRVTMLYIAIEVNGRPVKAFVDSGAQATIISPSCAEACGMTHLIDERWQSIARGVGTAKILGRIHKAPLKIGNPEFGYEELTCSFTVLEGKDVDMLFGLDMLKRYQANINLQKNCLEFPNGVAVPFLPENELPKTFEEPVVDGPEGAKIGAQSGAVKAPGATAASSSAGPSASNANNFRGQGQTLGPGPTSASSSAAQSSSATQSHTQPPRPSRPTPASGFPESDVQLVMNIGASRDQAVAALQSAGGNVDMAAALIFDHL